MRANPSTWMLAAAIAAVSCGGGRDEAEEPEEQPMPVESTAVGELVTMPGRVEDRTNRAMDRHRESLESQIEASEATRDPPEPPEE